jgi:hypothetical protein
VGDRAARDEVFMTEGNAAVHCSETSTGATEMALRPHVSTSKIGLTTHPTSGTARDEMFVTEGQHRVRCSDIPASPLEARADMFSTWKIGLTSLPCRDMTCAIRAARRVSGCAVSAARLRRAVLGPQSREPTTTIFRRQRHDGDPLRVAIPNEQATSFIDVCGVHRAVLFEERNDPVDGARHRYAQRSVPAAYRSRH